MLSLLEHQWCIQVQLVQPLNGLHYYRTSSFLWCWSWNIFISVLFIYKLKQTSFVIYWVPERCVLSMGLRLKTSLKSCLVLSWLRRLCMCNCFKANVCNESSKQLDHPSCFVLASVLYLPIGMKLETLCPSSSRHLTLHPMCSLHIVCTFC